MLDLFIRKEVNVAIQGDKAMKRLRTWHEFLIEELADPEEALGYL